MTLIDDLVAALKLGAELCKALFRNQPRDIENGRKGIVPLQQNLVPSEYVQVIGHLWIRKRPSNASQPAQDFMRGRDSEVSMAGPKRPERRSWFNLLAMGFEKLTDLGRVVATFHEDKRILWDEGGQGPQEP